MSNADNSISLHELISNVNSAIKAALPSTYWVRAEVMSVKVRGATYVELSSYEDGGEAKATATIWKSQSKIVSEFEEKSNTSLAAGIKVLMRVQVSMHPKYGFNINIREIDATFSLGDMEARLNEIRKELQDKGEILLNKSLQSPLDFTRVAVIAPDAAAGLGDFRSATDVLASHQLCTFDYFDAKFQGDENDVSIISAMKEVVDIHRQRPYDALVMCRGGGAKSGLYQLNKARIARAVCRMPIPIMIGVGHEQDNTILDELANLRFATPSLVAAHIKGTIVENALKARRNHLTVISSGRRVLEYAKSEANSRHQEILSLASKRLSQAKLDVNKAHAVVSSEPKRVLNKSKEAVERNFQRIKQDSSRVLTQQSMIVGRMRDDAVASATRVIHSSRDSTLKIKNDVIREAKQVAARARVSAEHQFRVIKLLDPDKVVARGYILAISEEGLPVTNASTLMVGQGIKLKFRDGAVGANVNEVMIDE